MNLLNFHWFYGKTLKSEKELLLQTLFLDFCVILLHFSASH